jgi:pilus assembly protein CpaB
MNAARVLVLIVALAAGGIAAYLAINLLHQQPEPTPTTPTVAPATVQSEEVLVASKDIPLGAAVDSSNLAWRAWPSTGLNGAYISRSARPDAITALAGTIAGQSFLAGEPITEAKLTTTSGGLLAAMLPSGMRAVATSISAETGAGGFILPNDRVDVIMTRHESGADGADHFVTETVLQNVKVLAIDQQIEDQNGEQVVVGRTATFELTPQQAEILSVAQQMADRLTLSLRSVADADVDPAQETDAVHLLAGDPQTSGVTLIRNGVATQVTPGQ